jgi:hypothetical protein
MSDSVPFGRTKPKRSIAIAVRVSGLPPDVEVQTVAAHSRLEFPDKVFESERDAQLTASLSLLSGPWREGRAVSGAFGGARLLGAPDDDPLHWPRVIDVPDEDLAKYASAPGRLVVTLHVALQRVVLRSTLPLTDNATLEVGSGRLKIVRVRRSSTGYEVWLRHSRVQPLLSWPWSRYRMFSYALFNRARQEAVVGSASSLSDGAMHFGPFGNVETSGGNGFLLDQYEVQLPAEARVDRQRVRIDGAWLDGAELAVLDAESAGTAIRQLVIEGFKLQP